MSYSEIKQQLNIWVPLSASERTKLDAVCGPRRRWKRGEWVREAILEKLARDRNGEKST